MESARKATNFISRCATFPCLSFCAQGSKLVQTYLKTSMAHPTKKWFTFLLTLGLN